MKRILVINTGSTSTKLALFEDERQVFKKDLAVPEEQLKGCVSAVDQLPYRTEVVRACMGEERVDPADLDIIVARGGPLPPHQGGAYLVNDYMVDVLTHAPVSAHESALSCMIGKRLAEARGTPVIIYDGVSTDEMLPAAKLTGLPEVRNSSRGHPLNARKAARQAAKQMGIPFERGRFIVAHFGGSISVSAHKNGRIIDMLNAFNGPMSPQRAGRLPTEDMIKLCYSGRYTQRELSKKLNGGGGFMAYFGTQDGRAVSALVEQGDSRALEVYEAMALQCAKGIAEMRVTIGEQVDRIVFTGGLARDKWFTGRVKELVDFIAPVEIFPGECEMEALAEGALRVLTGQEIAKEFDLLPSGYASREEFYQKAAAAANA